MRTILTLSHNDAQQTEPDAIPVVNIEERELLLVDENGTVLKTLDLMDVNEVRFFPWDGRTRPRT